MNQELAIQPLTQTKAAIKEKYDSPYPRPHLGASAIGKECRLDLWHSFRWSTPATFDAETHLRFLDGHRSEDVMAQYLWMAGVELYTKGRDGNQFGFKALGGHFAGSMDGLIKNGVPWHKRKADETVWEHKSVNDKKFKKLAELVKKHGNNAHKLALKEWDEVYFAQAQVYMMMSGANHHWLTCSTAGCRDFTAVLTTYVPEYAEAMLLKAEGVISSHITPEKTFKDASFFKAKFLNNYDVIYRGKMPKPNFRNSLFAFPVIDENRTDAAWLDEYLGREVLPEQQFMEMPHHLFNPSLLKSWAVPTAMEDGQHIRWVQYETDTGQTFYNCQRGLEAPNAFNSWELANLTPELMKDPHVTAWREKFNATVTSS